MTAKDITSSIRWIMEDNCLDRAAGFNVKTTRKEAEFETVIRGVEAQRAERALAEYLRNSPGSTCESRSRDGYLVVRQPA